MARVSERGRWGPYTLNTSLSEKKFQIATFWYSSLGSKPHQPPAGGVLHDARAEADETGGNTRHAWGKACEAWGNALQARVNVLETRVSVPETRVNTPETRVNALETRVNADRLGAWW